MCETPTYAYRGDGNYYKDGQLMDVLEELTELRGQLAEVEGRLESYEFVIEVLRLADEYEIHELLWWRAGGQYVPVTFFVRANDLLEWGCADAERLTPENIGVLRQAILDCAAVDDCSVGYGCELFVCRLQGMRPQGAAYPPEEALWPLFNACGPEREVGFGNPFTPGEYPKRDN